MSRKADANLKREVEKGRQWGDVGSASSQQCAPQGAAPGSSSDFCTTSVDQMKKRSNGTEGDVAVSEELIRCRTEQPNHEPKVNACL